MKNWRELSNDPNAQVVSGFLRENLLKLRKGRIENLIEFMCEFARNQEVLDVGAVGHFIERSDRLDWKHGALRNEAKRVVGIDILDDSVKALKARGYDIRLMDATGDADMGERFDRIIIGDVIEHVDNPVALLKFARRHLRSDGKILCVTPNPFYIGNIIDIFKNDVLIANAEHVTWVTPSNAVELSLRSGLALSEYRHFSGSGNSSIRKFFILLLKISPFIKLEVFARSYLYVFQLDDDVI